MSSALASLTAEATSFASGLAAFSTSASLTDQDKQHMYVLANPGK